MFITRFTPWISNYSDYFFSNIGNVYNYFYTGYPVVHGNTQYEADIKIWNNNMRLTLSSILEALNNRNDTPLSFGKTQSISILWTSYSYKHA